MTFNLRKKKYTISKSVLKRKLNKILNVRNELINYVQESSLSKFFLIFFFIYNFSNSYLFEILNEVVDLGGFVSKISSEYSYP